MLCKPLAFRKVYVVVLYECTSERSIEGLFLRVFKAPISSRVRESLMSLSTVRSNSSSVFYVAINLLGSATEVEYQRSQQVSHWMGGLFFGERSPKRCHSLLIKGNCCFRGKKALMKFS